ncbi:MAG TPA: GntR family transcriptional regulator [Clostridia bacterium]|nr:GntR family transcriptional regulator [Clostridia bacterium]
MSEHKYAELAQKLREDIQSGFYTAGHKLPSENELADMTGFSRQTVRQAIGILEREGLANRIQGSGTYVRSPGFRREATRNIAVVTTYIGEYIFPFILHGIDEVLSRNGYTSMLSATRNRVDNERRILTELLGKPIDGMIVEGTKTALPNPNIDLYEKIEQAGIPVVFINGFYPDLKRPVYVVADDLEGGSMACRSLLDKGHTHIAGIFKSDDIQGHRRYAGYTKALRIAGITVRDDHVMWYTTENRDSMLEACAMQILNGCTAVVCYNDEVALKVMEVLDEKGVSIPSKMELASFDHSTIARLSARPFLSLANPKESLGRVAAEKLLNLLKNRPQTPTVLPWSLIE